MSRDPWNHNIHYHPFIMDAIPPHCGRALDVGCGEGQLAQKLATRCDEVIAIDLDAPALAAARLDGTHPQSAAAITFVQGDVLTYPLGDSSFDLMTVVATLHHMPLAAALSRFGNLLRPGGTLVVVGLYRPVSAADFVWVHAGMIAGWILRRWNRFTEVKAPIQPPTQTLTEIRREAQTRLPGALLQRRLLFRYTLVWRKPSI